MAKKTGTKTVKIVQTGSMTKIGKDMQATLKGLGLGKPRMVRELEDTPAVQGMLNKVRHLVAIQE